MMASRHWLLSPDELTAFNAHLRFEGATCCPDCREVYLLEWGECPSAACTEKRQAKRDRQRKYMRVKQAEHRAKARAERDEQRAADFAAKIGRPSHEPRGVSVSRPEAQISFNVRHSPLWAEWEKQKR